MDETQRQRAVRLKKTGFTYTQIGEQLGISRQRAQQLIKPQPLVYAKVVGRADGMCQSCFKIIEGPGHVHHRRLDVDDFNGLNNLLWVCLNCHPLLERKA
jgi:hypothetical protein